MQLWSNDTLKSLLVPGGVLLLAVSALASMGWLPLATPALSFLFYCALAGGMLLAWRFHSSRIFFALCALLLAEGAVALFGAGHPELTLVAVRAVAIILPVDFVFIALMHERGFYAESMGPLAVLLFVESIIVAALCRTAETALPSAGLHRHPDAFPHYVWAVAAAAGLFLLGRFLLTRKPADSALLWSLCAFFLSVKDTSNQHLRLVYSATSACILVASIIENSYLLAYHDELTGLPSRRAFHDALGRLREPFSIAVADIDHFKTFNDTYGHDTGDQVLRLVASQLARVTGGGCAYRCGGEEFNILFPGKNTSEVRDHLEQLREEIAASEFRMRGGDRRQTRRGPDRRNASNRRRRKSSTGLAIRELAQESSAEILSVTISIGVANSTRTKLHPDAVLELADKALYRAKANGRNRVEAAPPSRSSAKAAGIA